MRFPVKKGNKEDIQLSITINLHKVYQPYSNGEEIINVDGKTVNECLRHMIKIHPGLEKAIFIEKEKLHPLVEIFLNLTSTYPDTLRKEVKDGDKIHLIHTLAGG